MAVVQAARRFPYAFAAFTTIRIVKYLVSFIATQ
jgi:hypothetical protein